MPINIEVKARADDVEKLETLLRENWRLQSVSLRQADTFFRVPRGRLKMRCETDGQCELVYYNRDEKGGAPWVSHYFRRKARDPQAKMKELVERYGVKSRVVKLRHLYLHENARIHIDDVEGLGKFVEIEVVLLRREEIARGKVFAKRLMALLGITATQVISCSYDDLLDPSAVDKGREKMTA